MDFVEVEGKTYEEAVKKACSELNAKEEDLEIEVKEIDTKGILGIIGSKKVRIVARLKEKKAEETPEEFGKRFLENLMERIGISATIRVGRSKDRIIFSLKSREGNLFIGKNGEVLESIQHLLKLALAKRFKRSVRVLFDVNGFRERRKKTLIEMAKRLAVKVRRTGRPQKTEPLNAYERRIIHMHFKGEKDFQTKSEGEGPQKRVIISLKRDRSDGEGKE